MKIGLNATCFNDRPSGAKQRFIGIYTELFKHLHDDEFIVYEPADCQMNSWFDSPPNVVFKQTPLSSRRRLQKYFSGLRFWPSVLKSEKFDVFEGFHLPPVKVPTGHNILTIHDIRRIALDGYRREQAIYKKVLRKALETADHVITVSEVIRNDILELYPETSISVIYNGIDIKAFENITKPKQLVVSEKLNLPEDFLLAVGHFEKRKNYLNLIDALAELHRRGHRSPLVIIGNDSGEMAVIQERVNDLNLSGYVKIFSGLTDEEVRCAYKLCKLFVFPSSYEGFGIPILEAMAAQRPYVLSNIQVFHEITQGQGVYFEPDDVVSIANVIEETLMSASACERLVEYGNKRVQDFSFSKISLGVAGIYSALS